MLSARASHVGLVLLLFASVCLAQQPADKEKGAEKAASRPKLPVLEGVPVNVRELMQDRKYAEAIVAIDAALKKKDAPKDYLGYLRGRALHLQKKYPEAVKAYEQVAKLYPDGRWARRARFAKGVSLARKGDFRAAELVYRAEAEYLLSLDRKQEIADIYLEFAEAYFKPPKETDKPDYNKALRFYQQALAVGPQPQSRQEIEQQIARCHQKLGKHADAMRLYQKFIKDHPDSSLMVEARFRLGESQLDSGNAILARRTWQDLLALFGDDKSERIAEAIHNIARTYSIPTPGDNTQLDLGVAALESFIEKYPTHKKASLAFLQIGQSYQHRGRYEDAVAAYSRLLKDERYAKSDEIPQARNFLGHSFKLQQKFDEALATWREYLTSHPTHQAWSQVQREIINTEYLKAAAAYSDKKYAVAQQLWGAFLAKYPLDARSRQILFAFGQMQFDQKKWDDSITHWRRLVSKYPNTNESSQAQFMIAVTLEDKLGKLEDALKEYRKVTWGRFTSSAAGRANRLTAKQLSAITERVFRSDETPKLKLTTRNLEDVSVRIYTVDLETYFRKMHLARGVEGLDVSLIDPDANFDFKIPKYQKYQKLESQVEVSLPAMGDVKAPKSGVMVVTVSSKTYEATTLLLQSDLDVIVKSSRDEAFVYAQNMVTGKPWPDARILISNGKEVFAEGTTGDDGVLHESYKQLKSSGDVRVFAIAKGHVASNVVSLQGVGTARGLSPRGYIYTERPAYRDGQVVHIRGILRKVDGDTYTVAKEKKYQVDVYDNRNRLLHDAEIALNDFGSFHTHFQLPTATPQGQYRIVVHDDKESYQGVFGVHEYKLEPIRLEVDTKRTVFYRGEEITGKIRASFYYGAPLVGREVRYQLAGGRITTAKTDDKGEIEFKLATREFREAQGLQLTVSLPERNLVTAKNFFLATQGFSVVLNTERDLFLSGDTFDVTLTTKDAEGEAIAKALTLSVLRQTNVDGHVGEVLVEKHELKSDQKDGIVRKTLSLKKGGRYILRATGTDRFENPVTGVTLVRVSDEDDNVRLRVLANKHTFKVGDVAAANIHWREAPALALVTFQGAKILDYKLVQLQKGANKLPIPMTAKLAPNFVLSICVMTDVRDAKPDDKKVARYFHEASSSFRVERDLRVNIAMKPKKKGEQLRPGDEVEVTITTTDPQGKPVSAEVGLAMIEQSLLARYHQNKQPIHDFFRSSLRQSAVRTTSSIIFNYRPATRGINKRLLAERDRLELAEEETLALAELEDLQFANNRPGRDGDAVFSDLAPVEGRHLVNSRTATQSQRRQQEMVDYNFEQTDASSDPFGYGGQGAGGGIGGQSFTAGGRSNGTVPQSGASANHDASSSQMGRFMFGAGVNSDAGLIGNININGGTINGLDSREMVTHWSSGGQQVAEKLYYQNGIQTIATDGTFANVTLALGDRDFDADTARKQLERLKDAGVVLMPNLRPHETGYWNPAITTDKKGKAVVTFTLPDRSTAWKLLAKGITVDTLAGEDDNEFAVKKDLFGQLKLPTAFTDGDTADIIASVHNDLLDKGKVDVTLTTTVGTKSSSETQTLNVKKKGIRELVFKTTLNLPPAAAKKGSPRETVTFELTVAAADTKNIVRRTIPLRPYGMPVFAIAGGSASSDTTAFLETPAGMPLTAPSLQVILGPTVERSLLDVVLAPAPWCQVEAGRIASGSDQAVSDLMAALALQKLVSASREANDPQATALDSRVRSSVSLLISMQNDDGGWSWAGGSGSSNRYNTARITWALHMAKSAGYRVPADTCNKALNYVRSQIAKTRVTDYETKAVLLHALATAGAGDFPLANQLYRNRPALSAGGLVHLTLAFVEMDRKQTAAELLNVLENRNLDDATPKRNSPLNSLPWSHSPAELRALYALALSQVNPKDARLKKQVDWLMAHRTGHRWAPEKATGPAMLVLCDWFAQTRFDADKYELTIWVNDLKAEVVKINKTSLTRTIDIPAKLLAKKGKQRVRLEITGRGRYSYQCVLGGFVPAEKLTSTTQDWRVERYYVPAPIEMDGKEIPRGFNVLTGSHTTFRNSLNQLPVARRGQVELNIRRYNIKSGTPNEHLEYLVVTEPIPAGTTVIEKSITGSFERFEIGPDAITFYVGSRSSGTIRYDVHGYLPGKYRVAPTVVRNAYAADQIAVAKSKSLDVLALGAKSKDAYRLSPRELYELGKRTFDKREYEASAKHLGELLSKWNLADQYYKDTARMLLDVHLAKGPAADVVRYFEIVIQKLPELEIPFTKLVKIGDAYHEIGEYERSYLVFRATIEGSFFRESQVAGFLEEQGEFLRSVDVMDSLTREYPPEAYLASATYALAQRVYAKAPEAAGDAKLREVKINRVDLIRQSLGMLDAFLTAQPEDPAADEASFSLASAYLDLDAYEDAIKAATKYAGRYPDSTFVDSFWYIIGYCHYARGEHKEALAMCDKVAKATQKDPRSGREKESPNKWQAIYILGQIHHSLGKAQDAIREYTRVKDRFVDARQAIEYFARKDIKLPEVTTIKPGEEAKVELDFRNVPTCDTKVYRIDLMKFGLLKRNLGGITKINLAGIRPFHEVKTELGDGKDFRDRKAELKLPLKKIGAYLVVSRAENLHTSGLVLVTPLDVQVHEDPSNGRIRTTVKDVVKDDFVADVHVKVIGSGNQDFFSGETDLRGIFVADDIRGTSTVIALAGDDQYAFYRGELALGPAPNAPAQQTQNRSNDEKSRGKSKKEILLENLKVGNGYIQEQQKQQLFDLYKNPVKGGVKNFKF